MSSVLVLVAMGTGMHRVAADVSPRHRTAAAASLTTWAPRRVATVPAALATPVPERLLSSAPSPAAAPAAPAPVGRVRPVPGLITGAFLEPRPSGPHPGVDLDGETGDRVVAAETGVVVAAGPAGVPWTGYGTIVVIQHAPNVQSIYAHLSAVHVALGAPVRPGTDIGAVGSTGMSTGSHLHFEVRIDGHVVDPLAWVAARS